ncbi:MAG: hypothetical protein RLZZ210_91 [Pseudomonadota bacterium]|jgi:hypothetical protein
MKVSVPFTALVAALGLATQTEGTSTATKCKHSIINVLTSAPYNFSGNDFSVTYDGSRDVTVHCINGTPACNRLQTLNLTEVSDKSTRNCDLSKVVADMKSDANLNAPTKEALAGMLLAGVAAALI